MAILLPSVSIFGRTLFFIPESPVNQENGEKDDVGKGDHTIVDSRQTPTSCQHDFKDVVHMSGQPPEPTQQQFGLLDKTIVVRVLDFL